MNLILGLNKKKKRKKKNGKYKKIKLQVLFTNFLAVAVA